MHGVSRIVVVVGLLGSLAGVASAQPGRTYPQPPPQPSPTYPGQPGPYTPAPYTPPPCTYAPSCQRRLPAITPHEQQLLLHGEYTQGEIVGGGLIGTFFGFGLGHAVQGRWSDKGWLFTVGEGGAMALMMSTMADCIDETLDGPQTCNENWLAFSAIAFGVLRLWEIVDVWAGPARYNSEVRRLRWRLGIAPQPRWGLRLAPAKHGSGGTVGVTYRF